MIHPTVATGPNAEAFIPPNLHQETLIFPFFRGCHKPHHLCRLLFSCPIPGDDGVAEHFDNAPRNKPYSCIKPAQTTNKTL